jgi:hypothetical protein
VERTAVQSRLADARVRNLLHGGSPKAFYSTKISALPIALVPAPFTDPDHLLTGSQNIKMITVQYFQHLYRCTARPLQQKPWMSSPSIRCITSLTAKDPFTWPQLMDVPSLRLLLSKGNRRPTPGPDGWEKWFLRAVSDNVLMHVVSLVNYTLSTSHFPACVKDTNISTIHKRGPTTSLKNYRGIACSNFLLNLPFAWLNHRLSPYLTAKQIIPECRLATKPGVQGRDLLSAIAQMQKWACRHNIPLYVLQ